ncbi:MAG: Gfo/Idh/MocA family protein [Acidobacteriota bacterium]
MMIDRRSFVAASVAGMASRMTASPNDRIRLAVVGTRGRGRDHIATFGKLKGCEIAAVCDIDDAQSARGVQLAGEIQGARPKVYQDIRRLLEDKSIDAISVATCNHWHVLATIWACQAGKDVYVEKPASHNIWEGRRAVEAARKYNRIVQCGTQARSIDHYRRAIDLVHQGRIGKVYMAKGLCYKRRKSIGRKPDGPVPEGVNFDLWLGPAARRPFNPNRFHYNWHWFWDTGNGDIGNQGVHELDIARWGLNKPGLPEKVFSTGGKFVYDDDQQTPNTQIATFQYDDCQIVFEVRGILTGGEGNMAREGTNYIGVIFLGSEGYLTVDCTGYQVYLGEKRELAERVAHTEAEEWATAPHAQNFLDAVRSRRREDLHADIEQGHLSAALCHMANASYRVGRSLRFDSRTETFGADAEANRYVKDEYRRPFEVPEKV